jgi:hypothetical protein
MIRFSVLICHLSSGAIPGCAGSPFRSIQAACEFPEGANQVYVTKFPPPSQIPKGSHPPRIAVRVGRKTRLTGTIRIDRPDLAFAARAFSPNVLD